mgnify:FL=1
MTLVAPPGTVVPMTDVAGHAVAFQIGPKGRSVLPVAVRRAAGLEEGSDVVAIALGKGRVLLETVDAVRERVWAGAPEPDTSVDSVADVRRMRQDDTAISDKAAVRRSSAGSSASDERGAALLSRLGL